MRYLPFALMVLCIIASTWYFSANSVYAQNPTTPPEDVKLLSLVLISGDLRRATQVVAQYDKDGDGKLDAGEQSELGWRYEPPKFDLNKDGQLTHAEVAIRFAFRRFLAGVEERDEVFTNQMLRRYDRDRNRLLDPAEIGEGHWPDDPRAFDSNGDGRLDEFEVSAGLVRERDARTQAGVTGWDNGQAIFAMSHYDVDEDRRLNGDEFEACWFTLSEIPWRGADKNGDGLVTTTELAFAMAERRKKLAITAMDQREAFTHMKRIDRNRDRLLDAEEIVRGKWPEFPDQYDSDKNQLLTRFELESGFAAARQKLDISADDQKQAVDLIRRLDKNRNKEIDIDEVKVKPDGELPLRITIETLVDYDFDFNQKLSPKEVATLFAKRRTEK